MEVVKPSSAPDSFGGLSMPDEKEPFHPYPDAVEKHYCSYCDCEYYKLEDGTITPCCCTDDETIEQEEC